MLGKAVAWPRQDSRFKAGEGPTSATGDGVQTEATRTGTALYQPRFYSAPLPTIIMRNLGMRLAMTSPD